MKPCAVIGHIQHIVLTQENKTAVAPLLSIGALLILCTFYSKPFQDGA